jgi:hypothetical protein
MDPPTALRCYGELTCILAQTPHSANENTFALTALLLCFVVVAPLAMETVLRINVTYVTKRDHLFRSDVQTGWSNGPNLLTTRINVAGEEWNIRTDQNGQRLIGQNLRAKHRILILGDTLSFGEGIDIEDRFDVRMLASLPDTRVINTGTMGYGTDQEYVAFRNLKHLLESVVTVLIVLIRAITPMYCDGVSSAEQSPTSKRQAALMFFARHPLACGNG